MEEFKVDIRFPRAEDPDPNMIFITGLEDNCYECKDHLLNLEEEYVSTLYWLGGGETKAREGIGKRCVTLLDQVCQNKAFQVVQWLLVFKF